MNTTVILIIFAVALYFALTITIGALTSRKSTSDSEGYFLGNRGLSFLVVFVATFGVNMTAFVMLGLAGSSYHQGVGVWVTWGAPLLFVMPLTYYLGYRCWLVAKRYGYITPVEFYRERFQSQTLGVIMFIAFVVWTMPYVLTGVVGAGRAFEAFTDGAMPYWVGGLIVSGVVAYYTLAGGMLGTAWTNVVQVFVFMGFLLTAITMIAIMSGGPATILESVRAEQPGVLVREWSEPFSWGTTVNQLALFTFIIFLFPFVWMRMIAARRGRDLRLSGILYPIAILLTWGPAALLGIWGAGLLPGLEGPEADNIIFILSANILPDFMIAIGLVALLAIIMSSMDAQILTLSNMLSWDIIGRYWRSVSSRQAVALTRYFVVLLIAIVYLVSLVELPGIFNIAQFAFTGFLAFAPTMVGGIFWRRATKQGAIASLLVGQAIAISGLVGLYPTVWGIGPPFWVVVIGSLTFIIVSLITAPQPQAAQRFHGIWDSLERQSGSETVGTPIESEDQGARI